MEIEIKRNQVEIDGGFPKLLENKNTGVIILALDILDDGKMYKCISLHDGYSRKIPIGSEMFWRVEDFELFSGEIILKQ